MAGPDVSEPVERGTAKRRVALVVSILEGGTTAAEAARKHDNVAALDTARVQTLIAQHPTFGYRRLWAILRFRDGLLINRKAVYRAVQRLGWFVHQRQVTPRPRVQGWRSQATASNTRRAMDVTHIPVGADGWAHLAAVIDCHGREVIGYEFALRGRAREAERALEEAFLARFSTLRPTGPRRSFDRTTGSSFRVADSAKRVTTTGCPRNS